MDHCSPRAGNRLPACGNSLHRVCTEKSWHFSREVIHRKMSTGKPGLLVENSCGLWTAVVEKASMSRVSGVPCGGRLGGLVFACVFEHGGGRTAWNDTRDRCGGSFDRSGDRPARGRRPGPFRQARAYEAGRRDLAHGGLARSGTDSVHRALRDASGHGDKRGSGRHSRRREPPLRKRPPSAGYRGKSAGPVDTAVDNFRQAVDNCRARIRPVD